jgi:hypothetical protein
MIKSIPYCIKPAQGAAWLHTCNEKLLLAFIPNGADDDVDKKLFAAFEHALALFTEIREELKKDSSKAPYQDDAFVEGLYLVDVAAMTKAMSTIEGMSQTATGTITPTYGGSPAAVTLKFMETVLGDSSGNLDYLQAYLLKYMTTIQWHARNSTADTIGILTGFVAYNGLLEKTATTFTYVTATTATKERFESIDCTSANLERYTYTLSTVTFEYSLST